MFNPHGWATSNNSLTRDGIGGTAGLAHPSTGYMVARTLALAQILAESIVEYLGSTRWITQQWTRSHPLYHRVWNGLWPLERRLTREYYTFGMETLLKLDLNGTRSFFCAFFDLNPEYWHGFLSLFGHSSNSSRTDIVTKCPASLAKMMVVGECGERSGVYWWRRVEKVVVERRRYGSVMVMEEVEWNMEKKRLNH
ncbi:capsanthin/capsorubin synthase, chromoplastic-like protein [Tanacetum coccineum]|uniref:Capsanthin/capsorubin synthase, chromoplastic-like protein n=1 Tax=Tanacetum coccineum TaxID=301880 RepID=A0ABQ5GF81_9ASTR